MKRVIKAVNYGVGYFAVLFLSASIYMGAFKLSGDGFRISLLLTSIIILTILSFQYEPKSQLDGFFVGSVWLTTEVLLEYLILVVLYNKGHSNYYTWSVMINYMLIVFVPTLIGSRSSTT
jgi:hypothetical protein